MYEGTSDVTIVIPQHNQMELTRNCIRSIREREKILWPIVVVDDGSSPEDREISVLENFSGTRIVFQEQRGVSAAWNRGAKEATTDYLLFLNNDVMFLGEGVKRLIDPLRDGSSMISGVSLREEKLVPKDVLSQCPTNTLLEGWCFAVSLKTFQQLNGFDESMAVYWSDTDFQMRLNELFGKESSPLISCPELPLIHLEHCTARVLPRRREIWRRDRDVFLKKWRDRC